MTKDEIKEQLRVAKNVMAKNYRLARAYNKTIREKKRECKELEKQLRAMERAERKAITAARNAATDTARRAELDKRVQCSYSQNLYRCGNMAPVGKTLCPKHDPDRFMWRYIFPIDKSFAPQYRQRAFPFKRIHRDGLSPTEWIDRNRERARSQYESR
jgi:hypothetical protein